MSGPSSEDWTHRLEARNVRVLAERLDWPDGAAEACVEIGADNPGWHAGWRHGTHSPAGYYARHDDHWHLEPAMFGRTPDELRAAIRAHRCERRWRVQNEPGF